MGETRIHEKSSGDDLRTFMRALLEDVHALEAMLDKEGLFERGVRRVGAEQEMFLIDRTMRPANKAPAILEELPEAYFKPELGQFNLEANLSPQEFSRDCLSRMERELTELIEQARAAAERHGALVVLTGILPTLEKRDLGLESMMPIPRFYQLNQVMRDLRGGAFRTYIKGLDEFQANHDNVMLEACNTSFQVHFQVAPEEFAKLYNVAQVATAPVLAAAVNSPVLLRHRLWHETRVALFQQSIDTRSAIQAMRGGRARVNFGDDWVHESIMDIFREDVARYKVLIASEAGESPLDVLARGGVPELKALRLHNGTIYRWNRPCYGISGGKPHLRIEMRAIPAGPSIVDEMANAAFFFGLMVAVTEEVGDVKKAMSFDDAKGNFMAAARYGLDARIRWFGGEVLGATELIRSRLIPLARDGLRQRGIDTHDVDRYLGILEERVASGQTGARWLLDSLDNMDRRRSDECFRTVTANMLEYQLAGTPVHAWKIARSGTVADVRESYRTVGQFMVTDLFTVHPEDLIDLAASVMDWEHLRHVPVEDHQGHIVGLVTYRRLLRMVGQSRGQKPVAVREVMRTDLTTVTPETPTRKAMEIMRTSKVGCLPVVQDGRLVGLVTESDFMQVAWKLLDAWLPEA
jgi:CBS domain-containing protein